MFVASEDSAQVLFYLLLIFYSFSFLFYCYQALLGFININLKQDFATTLLLPSLHCYSEVVQLT